MKYSTCFLLIGFVLCQTAVGQAFSSGSSGADGALDLTAGDSVLQIPPSGIFNFTSVNIPIGRTLTFQNNLQNTPVVMLARGSVNIAGTINVSASGRTPGPGGFYGGDISQPGLGPGGGQPGGNQINGQWVGPLSLVPIIGGSGGAGAVANCSYFAGGPVQGGGGGGAVVIASSSSIVVGGRILADGDVTTAHGYCSGEASGSGGAIRLVANSISISGYTSTDASDLEAAVVRLEAPLGSVSYASGSGTAPVIATINPKIILNNPPTLQIVSIAGYPVPSYSGSSFSSIDLLLPLQLQDPIPVVVQATNVPVGSPITINFSGTGTSATATAATLSGTMASSTATIYVSNLNRSAVSYLFVSATFDPSLLTKNLSPESVPNAPRKIEVASSPGRNPWYRFWGANGFEIEPSTLSLEFRRAVGL